MNGTASGLSLVEVMVAVTIIGLVMGSLIMLQSRMFRRSIENSRSIERIIAVKNFFIEMVRFKNNNHREKNIAELFLHLTYDSEKVKQASALSKINDLRNQRIEAIWRVQGKTRQQTYIALVAQPAEKQ
jgi:prepilin-type N-terminal cleavage/methylation domain-containing protein